MSPPAGSHFDPDQIATEVAERYLPRLRVFAARRLRDAAAADDAAQETVKRVLEALRQGRVRDLQALPSYIFETARHVCQHAVRHAQRTAHAHEELKDIRAAACTDSHNPLVQLISAERCKAVRGALEQLDLADRELVRLSYVEGWTSERVAEELGLTAANVRVRRHRILRRVAGLLAVTSAARREPEE